MIKFQLSPRIRLENLHVGCRTYWLPGSTESHDPMCAWFLVGTHFHQQTTDICHHQQPCRRCMQSNKRCRKTACWRTTPLNTRWLPVSCRATESTCFNLRINISIGCFSNIVSYHYISVNNVDKIYTICFFKDVNIMLM